MFTKPRDVLVFLLLYLSLVSITYAQQTLSRDEHKALSEVQELLSSEKWEQAISQIDTNLPLYEKQSQVYATSLQLRAYSYIQLENYMNAMRDYKSILSLDFIDQQVRNDSNYTLAQINLMLGNNVDAASYFDEWATNQVSITNQVRIMIASAYIGAERYKDAITEIEIAIESEKSSVPEQWYQMLLAVYFEQDNYRALSKLLYKLVDIYPDKKNYWSQLASVHLYLDDMVSALATLDTAYRIGLLDKEQELINLFNLIRQANMPVRAAQLLSQWIDEEKIESSPSNLELLAETWVLARNFDEAEKVLHKILSDSNVASIKNKVSLQLARIYTQEEKYSSVLEVINEMDKPSFNERGEAFFLKGIAAYELGNHDVARDSFDQALNYSGVSESARRWLVVIDSENNRGNKDAG